jgi:hypothetical protein
LTNISSVLINIWLIIFNVGHVPFKRTQELYERPAKLMHRHLKESIDISVKSTLKITDIHYVKNNLYRARSEQLPKFIYL